ncbi:MULTISPECIES: 3-dehydroquinate synthase [Calothrix]|uniref:3-dehydroquinate synthase n=2 Tax=Calothrix TaxID=1186 RepID=A0ABR8A3X9_9CYAN|nr:MULTISPECIES: 3-dehydroquinate synthase [Calothrix]MBD2194284.1 3-dehydroquinate synthase [Calothrix parietina FACHB-288]MBD2229595.1 3-dehydroquinate synthase [Calothrix anomala FACHB-343]
MLITDNSLVSLKPIQQSVQVTFNYDVHFTHGLFELDNPLLAEVIAGNGEITPKKVLAVVDAGLLKDHQGLVKKISNYARFYEDIINLIEQPIIIPGGELVKNNPKFVEQIHQLIDAGGICRHSYVLAIGGGAFLDMVGYAAATAHRGIRLLRVPTTVLAQNDSGVGVKNGINAFGKKNFIGTFAPPYAVLNDLDFLTSLDDRDWRSGIAEAVKVALIKDADFFHFIRIYAEELASRDMKFMENVIYRCAQLHLEHIANSGDPFEKGSSRPLDFGHWAAHKLEQITDYKLRHGEAVAIGIALDSTYAYLIGLLSQSEWQNILVTLKQLGFTLYLPALTEKLEQPNHPHNLFTGLTEFREHLGGKLTITLLQGIGQGIEVNQVDLSIYKQAVYMLRDWL